MLEDFEATKDGKLAELAETMRSDGGDVGLATFVELLFRHAAAEDVARYAVGDLMRIAREGWEKLQQRTPGERRIEAGLGPHLD